jgi:hypothetical protein
VDVEATVTASVGIVDAGGPTVVVDDGTAAVAVVVPAGAENPRVGARIRVAGKVSSLDGGLRVVAAVVEVLGEGVAPQPLKVTGALTAQHEWRLVQVCGHVERLTKAGSRWRADLSVAGRSVAVLGEPGARIAAAGMAKGRLTVVSGIVRRSTSDSSAFVLVPRAVQDVWFGPMPVAASSAALGATAVPSATQPTDPGSAGSGWDAEVVPISAVASREGDTITVSGVVVAATESVAVLDDGTGSVRLGGQIAADALSLLEPGDAVEVAGAVARDGQGMLIVVDPERIVTLVSPDLGAAPSTAAAATTRINSGPPQPHTVASSTGSGAAPIEDADGLAHPASGLVGLDGTLAPTLVGAVAVLAVLGLALAIAVRRLGGVRSPIRRKRRP